MQANLSDVSYLAASAKDGGPFFFSVLFVMVVTGYAAHLYRAVCERKDPVPAEEEKNTYRLYFFYAISVGALATGISLWWWMAHESLYTLRGSIRSLSSAESVWSDDVFFKPKFSRGGAERRAEDFIIVQNEPFRKGTQFVISYQKTGGDQEDLTFKFDGTRPDFRVAFKDGHNELEPISPPAPAVKTTQWDLSLVDSAYAGVTARRPPMLAQQLAPMDDAAVMHALQNDRVFVGTEIRALDAMRKMSAADRARLAGSDGTLEPMIVSLLDLTRHEDGEVAYKAQDLLKRIDAAVIFRSKFGNARTRKLYTTYLQRLDASVVAQVVHGWEGAAPEIAQASRQVALNHWNPHLVRGTPAADGDEYWITGLSPSAVSTRCIQGALTAKDTSTDSKPPVQSEGNRVSTFSYSKPWVVSAADAVEKCGGHVEFGRALIASAE